MVPQVLLAMSITIFGSTAFFTSITYIAPMTMEEAGFSDAGIAGLIILFGLGLHIYNFTTIFPTLANTALRALLFIPSFV